MTRWKGLVCAGGLAFLLLAGCASFDVAGFPILGRFQTVGYDVSLQSPTPGRDRVVAGSLEVVAESAKTSLSQMGLAATVNRKGEAIHIASKTAAGAKFTLVLTREKTKDGEQTRAHVEWDGARDDQIDFKLLAQLETLGRR
jgi:hypothetical protein